MNTVEKILNNLCFKTKFEWLFCLFLFFYLTRKIIPLQPKQSDFECRQETQRLKSSSLVPFQLLQFTITSQRSPLEWFCCERKHSDSFKRTHSSLQEVLSASVFPQIFLSWVLWMVESGVELAFRQSSELACHLLRLHSQPNTVGLLIMNDYQPKLFMLNFK